LTNQIASKRRIGMSVLGAMFLAMFLLTGCNQDTHRPDVKDAVDSAMTQNNLGVVKVSQDRDKGVLTLTGDVISADDKARAESVAKQAAPGYTVANELGVRPQGAESQAKAVDSNLDSGIEDNYKAALKANKSLDDQSISYNAKNGALTLKGSVKTAAQKVEAAKLAKGVPNVKEVVNTIEVKNNKHSTAAN
jgi:hyperosmotically inducible protein